MPERDCWPTLAQQDLLLAALAAPDLALPAWRRYRAARREVLEAGELRMLPLVDANLRRTGAADDHLTLARAQRRKAAVAGEMLMRSLMPVLTALRARDIEPILLKGAALGLCCYREPGLRPMGDVDLLVRREDAERAVAVLVERGFAARSPLGARRMQLVHAEDFHDTRGLHVDLHWRLYPQRFDADDDLWTRSRTAQLNRMPVRVLSGADALLHVIVHGLHWSPQATLRWASDAAAILACTNDPVDWDVFAAEATRLGFLPAAREGLEYLASTLGVAVPPAALRRMAALRGARADTIEYRLGCRRRTYTVLGGLPVFAFQYARDARAHGRTPQPAGFLAYMAEYWGYDSVSRVLRRMASRAALRAWSRLSGRALPPPDPV